MTLCSSKIITIKTFLVNPKERKEEEKREREEKIIEHFVVIKRHTIC